MINFNNYANENKTKHNLDWPYIPDHQYRKLIKDILDLEKQMHY